jgi:hypothetical protein
MILNFAEANGIELTGKPMQGIAAVHPEGAPPGRSKNPHAPLALFGRIAAHLSVIHQLTMWLERLLGVRTPALCSAGPSGGQPAVAAGDPGRHPSVVVG